MEDRTLNPDRRRHLAPLHHKKHRNRRHRSRVFYLFVVNVTLATCWGPVFITLTALGPLRHLSSTVVWVAIISYYANMMGNIATAAALYSSMVAHDAHDTAIDTAHELAQHKAEL